MTTGGITEAGIPSNLISQKMDELKHENQPKSAKGKEVSNDNTDTVTLTAGIWEKELMEIDAIDEKDAIALGQLAANNLGKQSLGMSTQGGLEALRALV
ncbi:MAG: hypothetical protein JRL30_20510 [Deltaproteobacteria bacterium]|nr:hypothetical protein [Deltaproteobacteria bacterium]